MACGADTGASLGGRSRLLKGPLRQQGLAYRWTRLSASEIPTSTMIRVEAKSTPLHCFRQYSSWDIFDVGGHWGRASLTPSLVTPAEDK